jgi:cell division protein FtsB
VEEVRKIAGLNNVDLGIWQKLTRVMAVLIFVAAILVVVVWYIPLFQQNERMRKEIQSLQGQIRREEAASRALENHINALKNDPKTVERMAREKLGYAKTGETVIYFQPRVTNGPIVTPSQ